MKKLLPCLLICFLWGCEWKEDAMEEALGIRGKMLSSDCHFRCVITADYGDTLETFTLDCESETNGELGFTVVAPESISGISGSMDPEEGELSFEDVVLGFPLLAGEEINPVSAPWILMNTLRKGCITSVAPSGTGLVLSIDSSYADDAWNLEIWTDEEGKPVAGEISVQGRRRVSMQIEDFGYE